MDISVSVRLEGRVNEIVLSCVIIGRAIDYANDPYPCYEFDNNKTMVLSISLHTSAESVFAQRHCTIIFFARSICTSFVICVRPLCGGKISL